MIWSNALFFWRTEYFISTEHSHEDSEHSNLHLDKVGSQPVDDFEVGGEVAIRIEVVLVGLLFVSLLVEDGPHLLQDDGIGGDQTQQLQVPLDGLINVPQQLVQVGNLVKNLQQ